MNREADALTDPHDAAAAARPDDFGRVVAALAFLERRWRQQPGLDEVAAAVGLSPGHLQRLFRRWAGVSPKRFLQFLTVEDTRARLRAGRSVLDAALESGLSGPSRLHDLFLASEAMTPGQYRAGGAGLTIRFGCHDSPFGRVLVACSHQGICQLDFADDEAAARRALADAFPAARLEESAKATGEVARALDIGNPPPLPLAPRGTNFELAVWRALLRLPPGVLASYGDIARFIGRPRASRAVGRAVGANPIALLIPCHRIVRASGVLGHYAGGPLRKRALVGREGAQAGVTAGSALRHAQAPG